MNVGLMNRLEKTYQLFNHCPCPNKRGEDNGWTIKEVLGHLVDSASNNHQRLLRHVPKGALNFPAYDQEAFVARANYRDFEYRELLTLFYYLNKLLFHIYENFSEDDLESSIKVGENPPVSIRQLMKEYSAHIELHENQVREIMEFNEQ